MIGVDAPLYLGVDAGGTFTRCALIDASGVIIGRGTAGAANHYTTPPSAVRASVREAIAAALGEGPTRGSAASAPRERVRVIAIGWSGLEEPGAEADAREFVGNVVNAELALIDSDVMAAHVGAFAGAPGVLVTAGTGSIALAVDARGARTRVGGWGHRFGDEGSAAWIGTEGVRAALHGVDGRGPVTTLWEALLAYTHIGAAQGQPEAATVRRVTAWLYEPSRHLNDIAGFAQVVDRIARLGDATAIEVLDRAGIELARHVERASAAVADIDPLPVAGSGGVWSGSDRVSEACRTAVATRLPSRTLAWRDPVADAAVGAAWMAMRADGRPIPYGMRTPTEESVRRR